MSAQNRKMPAPTATRAPVMNIRGPDGKSGMHRQGNQRDATLAQSLPKVKPVVARIMGATDVSRIG
jgi:hypothetical protein